MEASTGRAEEIRSSSPYLLLFFFVLVSFSSVITGAAAAADGDVTLPPLPQSEVEALSKIGAKLGKDIGEWNVTVRNCSALDGEVLNASNSDSFNKVTCNCSYIRSTVCHVTSIQLTRQNLTGMLPEEVVNLTYLRNLDLSQNYLSGQIPAVWASLRVFNLSLQGNRISRNIPARNFLPASMAYSLRLPPPITTSRHVDFDSSSGTMLPRMRNAQLRGFNSIRITYNSIIKASRDPFEIAQECTRTSKAISSESDGSIDPFVELKQRFLCFKKENCMDNPVQYEKLSKAQEPKFMVVACADSRVCPSRVLGFKPGEAFTIRNVGNIIPPFQYGTSETNAALQFAVNTLEVSNILVVGHSQCGGIQALMSMEEDETDQRNFTKNWVSIAKSARLSTKAAAGHLNFEQQCKHCERESLNGSLFNLLTYPWIEKRVVDGKLSIHGGYYNFIDCTFEKWSLVYRQNMQGGSKYGMKNHTFWS